MLFLLSLDYKTKSKDDFYPMNHELIIVTLTTYALSLQPPHEITTVVTPMGTVKRVRLKSKEGNVKDL